MILGYSDVLYCVHAVHSAHLLTTYLIVSIIVEEFELIGLAVGVAVGVLLAVLVAAAVLIVVLLICKK